MKTKRLLALPIAAFALAPFAAWADGGHDDSRQWLESLQGTRSVQEVRAEALRRLPTFGDLHPVEVVDAAEATRSRADVRSELAHYGPSEAGA